MVVIIRTRWEAQLLKAMRKEIFRFMNVDSFPVVSSLTIECIALLYVVSARPGVQQHFTEKLSKGQQYLWAAGQLWHTLLLPQRFFYLWYPDWILFKPILNSNKALLDLCYTITLSNAYGPSFPSCLFLKIFSIWQMLVNSKITLSVKGDTKWLEWWFSYLSASSYLKIEDFSCLEELKSIF